MSNIAIIDGDRLFEPKWSKALKELGHPVTTVPTVKHLHSEDYNLGIVCSSSAQQAPIALFEQVAKARPMLAGILVLTSDDPRVVTEAMTAGFSRVCVNPSKKEIVEAITNILENIKLREDVTRLKTLMPLYNLAQKFLAAEQEQQVYDDLVEVLQKELKVPAVSIMIHDGAADTLKVTAYKGLNPKFVEGLEIKPGEKIAGKVFKSKKAAILNRKETCTGPYNELLKRVELSSAISFPMMRKERVLGVLNVSETDRNFRFSEGDIEMVSIIADQAMMAIDNIRAIKEREEQNRVRFLLERYVSPEVSNLLSGSGEELLRVGSIDELTILFADIRKFSFLVQKLSPGETRLFLNSFFEIFATSVFSHKGMLDKFIGDAALAVFGAPIKPDNVTLAAADCALQIEAEFEKLRIQWAKKYDFFKQVGLGVGVSRGPVFLGNVGSSTRLDYTVIGTAVNVAQRLASETEPGKILITEKVKTEVAGEFTSGPEQKMFLRGIEGEVTVYQLLP